MVGLFLFNANQIKNQNANDAKTPHSNKYTPLVEFLRARPATPLSPVELEIHCFKFPEGLIDLKPASMRSFVHHSTMSPKQNLLGRLDIYVSGLLKY